MAAVHFTSCSEGAFSFGLVKSTKGYSFVAVHENDGHSYRLETKGSKGGPQERWFRCRGGATCNRWISQTDGVILHTKTCNGGPTNGNKKKCVDAVVDWALFMTKRSNNGTYPPFVQYGKFCGYDLNREDFEGMAVMEKWYDAATDEKIEALEASIEVGVELVRDFNERFPGGPNYQPKGAARETAASQVEVGGDRVRAFEKIEALRRQAKKRIEGRIASNAQKILRLKAQNKRARLELTELDSQYDRQQAILVAADAEGPVEEDESSESSSSESSSSESSSSYSDSTSD